MKKAIKPRWALLDFGIKKHIPAASRVQHMLGNVKRRRPLRPKVSMVQTAGHAKTKFTRPKPHDASKEFVTEAPAWEKTVDE